MKRTNRRKAALERKMAHSTCHQNCSPTKAELHLAWVKLQFKHGGKLQVLGAYGVQQVSPPTTLDLFKLEEEVNLEQKEGRGSKMGRLLLEGDL